MSICLPDFYELIIFLRWKFCLSYHSMGNCLIINSRSKFKQIFAQGVCGHGETDVTGKSGPGETYDL